MVDLKISKTSIPGLLVIDLPVHADSRGWLKENWHRGKMIELGLPDFNPIQNNVIFNKDRGVTRGIHAEPWDKYITVNYGVVFAAIVDLRPGENFGTVETFELGVDKALFVPRNCGNSYQALEANTVYSILANVHWSPDLDCTFVNPADIELDIRWPISLDAAELSEKDKNHPTLYELKKQLST